MDAALKRVLDDITHGRLQEARTHLQRIAKLDPLHPHVLLAQAELMFKEGHGLEASALARDLAVRYQNDPHVVWRAGRVLARAGEKEEAEAAYRAALNKDAVLALPRIDLAWLLLERGRAVEASQQVAILRPMGIKQRILLELEMAVAAAQGNGPEVASYAHQLVDLAHDGPTLRYCVVKLVKVGEIDTADTLLRRKGSCQLGVHEKIAWAVVKLAQGSYSEAAELMWEILPRWELITSSESLTATLALCGGRRHLAESLATSVLDHNPQDAVALAVLANLADQEGDTERSVSFRRQLSGVDPLTEALDFVERLLKVGSPEL